MVVIVVLVILVVVFAVDVVCGRVVLFALVLEAVVG